MGSDTNAFISTHSLSHTICICFSPYLEALVLVMVTRWPTGWARRARLRVIVLTTLQAGVVAAAIGRREVCVPKVISQWTLRTGVEEAFPLNLLNVHLWVSHPSSNLCHKEMLAVFYIIIYMCKFVSTCKGDTHTHMHMSGAFFDERKEFFMLSMITCQFMWDTRTHTEMLFKEVQTASLVCHALNTLIGK